MTLTSHAIDNYLKHQDKKALLMRVTEDEKVMNITDLICNGVQDGNYAW